MSSSKSPQYSDLVVNAFKSIQAWKAVFVIQSIIIVALLSTLVYTFANPKVLLVPQNFSSEKGIPVSLGSPFSPDYMTQVGVGDAYNLLSWTPETIDLQYSKFIARMAPSVSDAQRQVLLAESKQHREEGLTQSFHVARYFVKGTSVELHGYLVRAVAGKEIFRGPAAYTISYADVGNGLVLITGVSQPTANVKAPKSN